MSKPDYDNAVYAASFPQFIDGNGRSYFIFQILNEANHADKVFYREIALDGSEQMMKTVVEAYIKKRRLKVWLAPEDGPQRVRKVELGDSL